MNIVEKSRIVEAHSPHWPTVWVWCAFLMVFFAAEAALGWSVAQHHLWLTVLLVPLVAHLMHAHILGFHEAAHGTLCAQRLVNDVIGTFIGTLSLQSLTAFRAVHRTHHNHLGTTRDEELWPFVIPTVPRWVRRLIACYELTLGISYTPMLCLRAVLRRGSTIRHPLERRRIVAEYVGIVIFWSAAVAAVATYHAWSYLLLLYVLPGILAGNMHSLRKYIEHMGLTGDSVLSTTRSVVATGPVGRFVAFTMFNIPFHAVHHRYAKIPQARLPEFFPLLTPAREGELPPYPSYWHAFRDMVGSLHDPRVGAQWKGEPRTSPPGGIRTDAGHESDRCDRATPLQVAAGR